MTSSIVIVGAGHAGVQAADSLRDEGFEGRVTLVGGEQELPYQRPPLTKDYLHGDSESAELLPLRAAEFYESRGIELRLGSPATRIDRENRRVALDDGTDVGYDHLILATGSRSRPYPGKDPADPTVHSIHRAEHATRFGRAFDSAASLAIVGAGFIGLEVAAAARKRGIDVTIVSLSRPAARVATPRLSEYLTDAHTAAGSRFIVDKVTGVDISNESGGGTVATHANGSVSADLVLVAIGALPNVDLARDAGLAVSTGVEVDEFSQTSDERISAIGDIAARPAPGGARVRDESVQAATAQARSLARTLTGRPTSSSEVPWFWSNQGDLRLQIAGTPYPGSDTVLRGERDGGRFSVFCFDGDRLVTVESINSPGDHLAARRILASGVQIDRERVADAAFDLKAFSLDVARNAPVAAG